ncbi:MAG: MFS transporter [Desulfobacterales bacterium]|nr:MAG: MFS transporter [Desulfobacterales bacterium]
MLSSLLNPRRIDGSSRFYYGWIIVAVALVSMAFWLGIRSCFSVFYVALLEEFPWNRGDSAGVQSMALITYTVVAPMVGGLIDRFGPRRIVVPGILVLVAGLVLCSTIETLAQFYILYGVVMGTGITCIGIVTYSAILAHWFEKKRGLASGIAVSGMGLGTFFLVPLSQSVISIWGWRVTFMVIAALVLVILLPANALFLKHKPEDVGQCADGLRADGTFENTCSNNTDRRSAGDEWTTKKIFLSGRFWALMGFTFFSIIGIWIMLVHNVRFLVDQGIDKMTAALIFAMVGVVSSIFRIFWGWLSDRIGREITFTMGILCGCMGVGSLILLESSGMKWFAYSFFIFFGMGWGVAAPMFIAVAADLFKGKVFGLIYGFVEAGVGIAGAFGAWVAGYIFDKTQSYQMAFILVIVVMLLSCLFIWLAAPRKFRLPSEI